MKIEYNQLVKKSGVETPGLKLGLEKSRVGMSVTCQKVGDGKVKNKEVHPCHFAPKYRIELLYF